MRGSVSWGPKGSARDRVGSSDAAGVEDYTSGEAEGRPILSRARLRIFPTVSRSSAGPGIPATCFRRAAAPEDGRKHPALVDRRDDQPHGNADVDEHRLAKLQRRPRWSRAPRRPRRRRGRGVAGVAGASHDGEVRARGAGRRDDGFDALGTSRSRPSAGCPRCTGAQELGLRAVAVIDRLARLALGSRHRPGSASTANTAPGALQHLADEPADAAETRDEDARGCSSGVGGQARSAARQGRCSPAASPRRRPSRARNGIAIMDTVVRDSASWPRPSAQEPAADGPRPDDEGEFAAGADEQRRLQAAADLGGRARRARTHATFNERGVPATTQDRPGRLDASGVASRFMPTETKKTPRSRPLNGSIVASMARRNSVSARSRPGDERAERHGEAAHRGEELRRQAPRERQAAMNSSSRASPLERNRGSDASDADPTMRTRARAAWAMAAWGRRDMLSCRRPKHRDGNRIGATARSWNSSTEKLARPAGVVSRRLAAKTGSRSPWRTGRAQALSRPRR